MLRHSQSAWTDLHRGRHGNVARRSDCSATRMPSRESFLSVRACVKGSEPFSCMNVHNKQMCCCTLSKLFASMFLFTRCSLSRSPNRSAGEHLDVHLLLILPSPSFFSAHPALSPFRTPLFIPPSVTGQTDEEKCQPPEEMEGE